MKAWNAEAGYTFNLVGMETVFGVAYQGIKMLMKSFLKTDTWEFSALV
jgi:hypothetical protein